MDNNLYIAGALTLVAGVVGFYFYRMGCTNSVQPSQTEKDKITNGNKKDKSNKNDPAKYPGGKVSIFFGSQTGTAETFARTLTEEGKAAGFDAKSVDLEEFDPEVLANTRTAIFLMATYGEGEPTDNASKFFKWAKNEDSSVENDFLSKLDFTVFGLGNRQYEHFNRMGKLTDKFVEGLGAKRVYNYGEGDDDGTLEEDFEKWRTNLWTSLRRHYGLDSANNGSSAVENSIHTPKPVSLQFTVKSLGRGLPSQKSNTKPVSKIQNSTKHFFNPATAVLTAKRELRNQSFGSSGNEEPVGSTLHLEFDLRGTGVKYITADNLAIIPENSTDLVNSLAAALGYDLNEVIDIEPTPDNAEDFRMTYPTPCTIRDLLTYYVDIQGKLQQSTLKHLIAYVEDDRQRSWLQTIASSEHRQQYHAEIEDERKSFVDLFSNELSSIKLPLAEFLHITSPIQARDYTISSSSSLFPDTVHLTVGITDEITKRGKQFVGLTSNYFRSLIPNQSRSRLYVKESTFRLPKSLSSPVIFIGPGTGIAPMRALLQERQYLLSKNQSNLGKALLFFGCRHAKKDYIYEDELQQFKQNGSLQALYTAFSRDTAKKVYVQHLLTEQPTATELISLILEQDAYIYVCGATAMGNDVLNTFIKLIADHKGISVEESSAIIKKLQEKKANAQPRYVQELWS